MKKVRVITPFAFEDENGVTAFNQEGVPLVAEIGEEFVVLSEEQFEEEGIPSYTIAVPYNEPQQCAKMLFEEI